jgi:sugar lactone lactonase YvrE
MDGSSKSPLDPEIISDGIRPAGPALIGMMRKALIVIVVGLATLAIVLMVAVRLRYGGGRPYPDLSTAPSIAESKLEIAVTFDQPIGNVAVSRHGRVFFTVHPESRPVGPKLLEWVDGEAVPFPSAASQDELFQTPLGVVIDHNDRLWTIDHGNHGFGTARLLAFDLATGSVVHDHSFLRSAAPFGSFLQDLQVDPNRETIYIADVGFWARRPALVVYDIASQTARRVLERHPSVFPQDWIIRTPTKRMVFFGGLAALKPGVDGLAVDPQGEWLYYGAMTHDGLYRVRTDDLRNSTLTAEELNRRVERFSDKPLNDGLSTDLDGAVYITDVEHGAVMRVGADRRLETLVKSQRIRWADALSFGPEGWLYVADSALQDQVLMSKDHIAASGPYFIYRFQPGVEGRPGH